MIGVNREFEGCMREAERDSQGAMDARPLAGTLGDGVRVLSPKPAEAESRAGK